MIEWFDDLALGVHFKSGDKLVAREGIIRFSLEFDPPTNSTTSCGADIA